MTSSPSSRTASCCDPPIAARLVESLEQAFRHGRGRAAVLLPDAGGTTLRFSTALACAQLRLHGARPVPQPVLVQQPARRLRDLSWLRPRDRPRPRPRRPRPATHDRRARRQAVVHQGHGLGARRSCSSSASVAAFPPTGPGRSSTTRSASSSSTATGADSIRACGPGSAGSRAGPTACTSASSWRATAATRRAPPARAHACDPKRSTSASAGCTVADVNRLPIAEAERFFAELRLGARQAEAVADLILGEVRSRLRYLVEVGPRLSHARPPVAHPVGRRARARRPDDGGRLVAGEHALRARRAVDRAASRATPSASSACSTACATRATPSSWSSTTPPSSAPRITSSISAPAPASAAARCCSPGRSRPLGQARGSLTAEYLSGRRTIPLPVKRRRRIPGLVARPARGVGEQPAGSRRRHPARMLRHRDGRLGLGQVEPGRRRALPRAAEASRPAGRRAGRVPRDRGRRAHRRRHPGRPEPDRLHAARERRDLPARLRRHPRLLRAHRDGAPARLHARHLLVQRRGRALRDLRRRGLRAHRDAVPLRRLRALRRVSRREVPARGAGGALAGSHDPRGPRPDRHRGARGLRRDSRGARPAAPAVRRRPRLPAPRPAALHAIGRRGPAPEARGAPRTRGARAHPLHLRRADHRAPSRGHREAPRVLRASGGARQLAAGHRAQPRSREVRRLGHRAGAGRRRGRRPRRRRGTARGRRRARRLADRRVSPRRAGTPGTTVRPTRSRRGPGRRGTRSGESAWSGPGSTTCATSRSSCRATS